MFFTNWAGVSRFVDIESQTIGCTVITERSHQLRYNEFLINKMNIILSCFLSLDLFKLLAVL